jgi:type II secretory pathway pseudopilin PulG
MTGGRIVAIAATAAVLAAIVAGLILTGLPGSQRELRLDEQRVADLRRLANSISRYYDDTGRLPDRLDSLVDGRTLTQLPRDPTTGAPYGYATADTAQFRLCAEFARGVEAYDADDFWSHDSGFKCFEFDFTGRRLD